jgi:hypothetical protein
MNLYNIKLENIMIQDLIQMVLLQATDGFVQVSNLVSEFRPHFEQKGDYDFAIIKVSHLFESLGKMGLVRRFDATKTLGQHRYCKYNN